MAFLVLMSRPVTSITDWGLYLTWYEDCWLLSGVTGFSILDLNRYANAIGYWISIGVFSYVWFRHTSWAFLELFDQVLLAGGLLYLFVSRPSRLVLFSPSTTHRFAWIPFGRLYPDCVCSVFTNFIKTWRLRPSIWIMRVSFSSSFIFSYIN